MTIEDAEKALAAARGRCDELELRLFKLQPRIVRAWRERSVYECQKLSPGVQKLKCTIQQLRALCAEMQASIDNEKAKALSAPKET